MAQSIRHNLVLASAALGAGAGIAGGADAATFSTAPAGFGGATITQDDTSSYTFDVSGSGVAAITFQGQSPGTNKVTGKNKEGKVTANANSGVVVAGDGFTVASFATPQETAPTTAGFLVADGTFSNFGATPSFGSFSYTEAGATRLGYFTGSFANNAFTVSDYGRVAAVPEAATWALLTLGFGGMGAAMRRRKRAARGLAAA